MNIDEVRNATYNDLLAKLAEYGKCAVIRCTGFGKTVLCSRLIQENE